MRTKRSDFLGLDFDWFAIDSAGFFALMSSAGYGMIPDFVFDHFDSQQKIGKRFEELTHLPGSGDLHRFVQVLADIGVFSYDWCHWNGPYRRIGVPSHPIHLDALGFELSLRDAFVRFPELQFCAQPEIEPQAFFPCS